MTCAFPANRGLASSSHVSVSRDAQPFVPADRLRRPLNSNVGALVAFLTGFFTELGKDVWALLKAKFFPGLTDEVKKKDKILLEKFLAEFPSTGRSCRFLSDQDVGAPFSGDDLKELDNFINNWNNADHRFLNKKIENQRIKLWGLASEYRPELSRNIFLGHNGLFSMDLGYGEKNPEKETKRNELNEMANQIYKEHQELIRLGKKYT